MIFRHLHQAVNGPASAGLLGADVPGEVFYGAGGLAVDAVGGLVVEEMAEIGAHHDEHVLLIPEALDHLRHLVGCGITDHHRNEEKVVEDGAQKWQVNFETVLLGPSHRVPFAGLALSSAEGYATPVGEVAIDALACRELLRLPQVSVLDQAHAQEHSLEVHLPFLRAVLGDFLLIPVVVGDATTDEVAEVIESFWDCRDVLIVVSSDLSHFLDYETANRVDRETTLAIESLDRDISPEQACGCRAINGLMKIAHDHALDVTTLDLRNSGDTAGDRSRVVGYGAYALT